MHRLGELVALKIVDDSLVGRPHINIVPVYILLLHDGDIVYSFFVTMKASPPSVIFQAGIAWTAHLSCDSPFNEKLLIIIVCIHIIEENHPPLILVSTQTIACVFHSTPELVSIGKYLRNKEIKF
jgi:hypothetical protein